MDAERRRTELGTVRDLLAEVDRLTAERDAAVARAEAAEAAIQRVRELHWLRCIYDECGHDHTELDVESTVVDIEDVGLTCDDGYLYSVCWECCTDDGYQHEECATYHDHGIDGGSICATIRALDGDEAA